MPSLRSLALALAAALFAAACAAPAPRNAPAAAGEPDAISLLPLVLRPRVLNLGRLRPGAPASRRIDARAAAAGAVITGARVEGAGFSVEPGPESLPDRHASFGVRFEGSRAVGPVDATVLVAWRDASGERRESPVPVVGAVAGDIRVARGIYLHRRGGRFEPRDVIVGRRSGRTVRIRSVEDPDGLLGVTLVEPASKMAIFRLEVADPAREDDGRTGHPLLLHVDDDKESPVEMEYRIDSRAD